MAYFTTSVALPVVVDSALFGSAVASATSKWRAEEATETVRAAYQLASPVVAEVNGPETGAELSNGQLRVTTATVTQPQSTDPTNSELGAVNPSWQAAIGALTVRSYVKNPR